MDAATRGNGLKEPFISDGADETDNLSEKLTENIENINESVQNLEDYELQLGTKADTRTMRRKMKEHITRTNDLIKKTAAILKQFEALKPKGKNEIDSRNKILKRTKENFNKQQEKFNKTFKDIQTKEKIYLDARKSLTGENQNTNSNASTDIESDLQIHAQDLDFHDSLLQEREADIQDIRRLAHELNLTAQVQAQKINESSENMIYVQENVEDTEKNTESANKHLDEALKNSKAGSYRNLICLLVVLGVCVCLIVIFVWKLMG